MNASLLSRKMHTRPAAMIMVAVAAIYIAVTGGMSSFVPDTGSQGICLPSPGTWSLPAWLGVTISVGLNVLIMVMMTVVNKIFNVLRSLTWLHVGLFAIMQAAVPREVLALNGGTLLALAVITCMYLLFRSYAEPHRVRHVFMAFLLLSLGATMQYCFVVFIPVLWLITAQMRILNLRTLLASLLGLATPWILLFGSGIVTPAHIAAPSITSVFSALSSPSAVYLLAVAALTAFVLFTSTGLNILKTIAYNARSRAYNGALTIVAIVTIAAMVINYNNMTAYLALLNLCAAYQLTHYFVNHRYDRQYAAVMAVCTVYFLLYIWRIIIQL